VNGHKVIELTCAEVVPLIARSGSHLDLVISRRPADLQLTEAASADQPADQQFDTVVDDAVIGQSLDRKHMKEDNV